VRQAFQFRLALSLAFPVFVLYLEACGPQKLTDALALSLLKQAVAARDGGQLKLDVTPLLPLLNKETYIDYKTATVPKESAEAMLQRLLNASLIRQDSNPLVFPNLSGIYSGTMSSDQYPFDITLEMHDGTAAISGSFDRKEHSWTGTGFAPGCIGNVLGSMLPDHTAALKFEETKSWACSLPGDLGKEFTSFKVTESAGRFLLTEVNRQLYVGHMAFADLAGGKPGHEIHVNRFSYHVTPEFQQAVLGEGAIRGGAVEVDTVANLLLEPGGASAHGQYSWHCSLSKAGKAVRNLERVNGEGTVNFGRHPNGQWVITDS
jgi:hypothetical protein